MLNLNLKLNAKRWTLNANSLSLRKKFLIPLFLIFAILSVSSVYLAADFARKEYISQIKDDLENVFNNQFYGHFKQDSLKNLNSAELSEKFEHLFNLLKKPEIINIIFYLTDGTVAYSDNKNLIGKKFEGVILSGFYSDIFSGRTVEKVKPDLSPKEAEERGYVGSMNVYVPISFEDGELFGFFDITFSLDELDSIMLRFQKSVMIFILAFFLLLSVFVIWFFRKQIELPILRITNKTQEARKGDLKMRITEENSREFNFLIGFINALINHMAKAKENFEFKIKEKDTEFQKTKKDLEEKTRQEIEFMNARVEQLEKFKNMAVSREERILELKDEVRRLKRILGEE